MIEDGWSSFISKKNKYKRYVFPNITKKSLIKVKLIGWGSSNDMVMHENDDKGWIMVKKKWKKYGKPSKFTSS